MKKVLNFLDLDDSCKFKSLDSYQQNKTRYPKFPFLMQLLNKDPLYNFIISKKISYNIFTKPFIKTDSLIHGKIYKYNVKNAPDLLEIDKLYLQQYFKPYNKKLEYFLGKKVPWNY